MWVSIWMVDSIKLNFRKLFFEIYPAAKAPPGSSGIFFVCSRHVDDVKNVQTKSIPSTHPYKVSVDSNFINSPLMKSFNRHQLCHLTACRDGGIDVKD